MPTYIMSHRLRRQAGPPTLEGAWHVNRSALEGLIVKRSMTRLDAVEVEEPSSQQGVAGWDPSRIKTPELRGKILIIFQKEIQKAALRYKSTLVNFIPT